MKKEYRISRYIIPALTFLIFNIMFINENTSWIRISFLFALLSFGLSFPSTILSKIFIKNGDKIQNKFLKILYYTALPIVLIIVCILIICMFSWNFEPSSSDLATGLGEVLMYLFYITLTVIAIILPYIQTIIVLIIRKLNN